METQKLLQEVGNATREALKRFGSAYGNSSARECSQRNDSSEESTGCSASEQAATQAVVDCLDALKQDEARRNRGSCEKETWEDAIDDALEQLSHLQLNKPHGEELETFSPQSATMSPQIKQHEAQTAMDLLTSSRLKDSRKNVDQISKLLRLSEKLQNYKRFANQNLKTLQDHKTSVDQMLHEVSALNRRVESYEKSVKKHYHSLYGKEFGPSSTCNKTVNHREPPRSERENLSQNTDDQNGPFPTLKDQQRNGESEGLNKQEGMEEVTTSLDQEMATWTDRLSSWKHSEVNLCTELLQLKHQIEREACQIGELESNIAVDESCCEKQQLEVSEDGEALRGDLELARKQVCKAGEEKSCLQILLEQRSHEALLAEHEALRIKLMDCKRMVDTLRLQIESIIQMMNCHSDTVTNLQQENISLFCQHEQEIQQLKTKLVQHQSDLECVRHERQQLEASLTKQNLRLQEETLEKQQAIKQLELQRMQLCNLNKEHEELQRLHRCKNNEREGVVMKLQSQLSSAHDELDKIRRSLRTLKAADGHGLQVALDKQKEITARREKIDSLQSRIQHLEEKVEKLQQEKRSRNLETHRHLQELTLIREEKRQLGSELKALRSKDHQLRERINELEAILHKMWDSLGNCQDFLQLREQEHFRLKLQHALNLKELQVQNRCAFATLSPPDLNSRTLSAQAAPPSSQYNTQIKESSACKLGSPIKEMQAVISDNHRPHTYKSAISSSFHRRRSAPERQRTATFAENEKGVKACSRLRSNTCGSEARFLETIEPDGKTVNRDGPFTSSPVSGAKHTTFPQILSLGRRSPVHTLLTSNPNS